MAAISFFLPLLALGSFISFEALFEKAKHKQAGNLCVVRWQVLCCYKTGFGWQPDLVLGAEFANKARCEDANCRQKRYDANSPRALATANRPDQPVGEISRQMPFRHIYKFHFAFLLIRFLTRVHEEPPVHCRDAI